MFQPARLNKAMVASCKLPLGIPSLSLLATRFLLLLRFGVAGGHDGPREAADGALVTDQAVAFNLDAEQQRVVVAIGCGGDDAQPVAAGLALHPQLLAGAAPKCEQAR